MAEIFIEIFGKKVEKGENLVKFNGQDRLPSPCQLQGKIILKGTERSAKPPKRSAVRRMHSNFVCNLYTFILY